MATSNVGLGPRSRSSAVRLFAVALIISQVSVVYLFCWEGRDGGWGGGGWWGMGDGGMGWGTTAPGWKNTAGRFHLRDTAVTHTRTHDPMLLSQFSHFLSCQTLLFH